MKEIHTISVWNTERKASYETSRWIFAARRNITV